MNVRDSADGKHASIVVQRRIEWPDTDASGRWHNTAGFRLIEIAETALLEHLEMLDEVYGRLPRVRIDAHFKRLLNFRDLVDASITVAAVGRSSVTYRFELTRAGDLSMRALVVAVLVDDNGDARTWPHHLKSRLLTAGPQPAEVLSTEGSSSSPRSTRR
jgi:acyl-CoA thioester hydrolase